MLRSGWPRRLALGAVVCAWLPGCATTVIPPASVAEPARIGLLDHGHHASLILETDDGSMVRYAYGDWQWYALGRTGVLEGIAALLWPTPAGLGRRQLPGPFSPAAVERGVGVPIEDALYLVVDAGDVRRLTARLDRIFEKNAPRQTNSELRGLLFVPHPEPYSILHNSNRLVAEWLEVLGCRVEGPTILSDWRRGSSVPVSPPAPPPNLVARRERRKGPRPAGSGPFGGVRSRQAQPASPRRLPPPADRSYAFSWCCWTTWSAIRSGTGFRWS